MKRAAHASIRSTAGTLRGHLTVAVACVALAAGCSTSGSTRHVDASTSTTVAPAVSTSTTARTTTTTTPSITYRVKRGDTLTKIANHFRVSISAIVSGNHVANPDRLTEGQTLRIPPAPPLKLVVTPPEGQAGQAFQLKLTGALPSETIKFEIDSPAAKYTGGPHTASADGRVTATYQTALSGPTGTYTVTATGNQGTTIRTGFRVVAAATSANT
jgi:LysM repeat protein